MKRLFFCLIGISLLAACGAKPAEIDKVHEDGVEVVLNHQKPYYIKGEPSELTLAQDFVIDAERPDLLEAGLADIARFDVDSQGRIYLIQHALANEARIFRLDERGRLQKSFGRTGEGPGEIQNLSYFGVDSKDTLLVFDSGRKKLLTFSASGELTRETLILKARTGCVPLENGNFMASEVQDRLGGKVSEIFTSLFSPEFEKIKTISSFEIVSEPERAEKVNVYPPYPAGAVTSDRIFLGYIGRNYEILVYDLEGSLIRKIRKDCEPVSVTDEFRKSTLSRAPKGNPIIDRLYFPDKKPVFQFIFTDEARRLFVMTSETDRTSGQNVCDIFTKDGVFISRASVGYYDIVRVFWEGQMLGAVAKNGRIYTLREKENGYKELVVYKALWR